MMDGVSAALAIVSPCSQCKNKREEATSDGRPPCPRRVLQKLLRERVANGFAVSPSYQPALLTGTEGSEQAGTDALRNPVYSDGTGHILVWVAGLADNPGVYDSRGQLIVPPLWTPQAQKDGGFDTDYIHCRPYPFTVSVSEAMYFQQGSYREWDGLKIQEFRPGQLMAGADGVEADFDPTKVAGLASKVNLPFEFPRQPVEKDLHPRGT